MTSQSKVAQSNTHNVMLTNHYNSVVTGLMAALGAPAGSLHAQHRHDGGAEARFAGDQNQNQNQNPELDHLAQMHPAHPFLQLFSSLGMVGPGGQMGDFVYSQEGLDRIVTRLMEQTASTNAPPPATQTDIDNLPRKQVDVDMLGSEHRAECSICMDEVNIGEEVTVLPCKHWFHHQCVSAWLLEHDTCPHCRQSISQHRDAQSNNSPSDGQTGSGAQTSGSRQMPGTFDVSGTGTSQDPFAVPGDASAAGYTQAGSSDNTNTSEGNGGIGDRIRRGLFGPQQ
jgi:E3 ubiquitin-protein ligase RNF115/126